MSSVLPMPSPEMLIDVVNERDEKIDEASRRTVLPAGRNFHTAHLFLFDNNGRLLLQQLSARRERHPLAWGASVAAYLFADETYEAAVQRRAMQELRVKVTPELVGKIEMVDERSVKFVSLFRGTLAGMVEPDRDHIEAVRLMTLEEIAAGLSRFPERFTPTFRQLFAYYLQSIS